MRRLFASCLFALLAVAPAFAQSASNAIGIGCLGSNGRPSLSSATGPVIGQSLTLDLTNLPTTPGQVWWMWSVNDIVWANRLLPHDMAEFGMPGCLLYLSPDYKTFHLQTSPGSMSMNFNVPVQTSLLSCRLLSQVLVCDSGINQVGYTTTNMVELLFGQ